MNQVHDWKSVVLDATGAASATRVERIQSLWSGYGEVARVALLGASVRSIVLKEIDIPENRHHPRGWDSEISHHRKVRSYSVERNWYEQFANQCHKSCRVPHCFGTYASGQRQWIVLEDLDAAGFEVRRQILSVDEAKLCLRWLAAFHAQFLSDTGLGLWEQGTYWHLQTRPDELANMTDVRLQEAAPRLDQELSTCQFMTLVHGDAKLANFCFTHEMDAVAAVDFQYVGRGCGMKDVAYFLGSCLDERDCAYFEGELLNAYFDALNTSVFERSVVTNFALLESEWRRLYPVAWTDFYRFLQGWSPTHNKINQYTVTLCEKTLRSLDAV